MAAVAAVGALLAAVVTAAVVVVPDVVAGLRRPTGTLAGPFGGGLPGAGRADPIGGTDGALRTVLDLVAPGSGLLAVTASPDAAYHAVVGVGSTVVTAVPVTEGGPEWSASVPVESGSLRMSVVADLLVIDAPSAPQYDDGDGRAVLDATTGALLWDGPWADRTDLAHLGTDVLVEFLGSPPSVLRVDLRTGEERWERAAPDDLLIIDSRLAQPVRSWPGPEPAAAVPPPTAGLFRESLVAGTDVVMLSETTGTASVLDGATGRPRVSGPVPIADEGWTAYGGMLLGVEDGAATALAAHALTDLRPAWRVPYPAGTTVEGVRPCGPTLVCAVVDGPGSNEFDDVVAYDVATGAPAWTRQVEWSDDPGWYLLGGSLLFGDATFDVVAEPAVLDPATGTDLRAAAADATSGVAAIAGDGGRAAVRGVRPTDTDLEWLVAVTDLASGRSTPAVPVGADLPENTVLAGNTLVVTTPDRHLRVYVVELPAAPPS